LKLNKLFLIFDEDKNTNIDLTEMIDMFHKFGIQVNK